MRIKYLFLIVAIFALSACGGRPTVPESPDPQAYGKTIQPFHQIPSGDQEGGGKARSTEDKSSY
ncbi:MAG: membrane lipoprotein lipid attachment site-containing protein [Nitrosomonas sp.]|nr:MAG: membrane lipoprotein lipid attachment site-containing protein [Nitrosomonas sp.]